MQRIGLQMRSLAPPTFGSLKRNERVSAQNLIFFFAWEIGCVACVRVKTCKSLCHTAKPWELAALYLTAQQQLAETTGSATLLVAEADADCFLPEGGHVIGAWQMSFVLPPRPNQQAVPTLSVIVSKHLHVCLSGLKRGPGVFKMKRGRQSFLTYFLSSKRIRSIVDVFLNRTWSCDVALRFLSAHLLLIGINNRCDLPKPTIQQHIHFK